MHTLILLPIFAIIAYTSWPYIKQGFDIVPDNSEYPVEGHTSPRSAFAAWKVRWAEKRADRACKRDMRRYLRLKYRAAREATIKEVMQ